MSSAEGSHAQTLAQHVQTIMSLDAWTDWTDVLVDFGERIAALSERFGLRLRGPKTYLSYALADLSLSSRILDCWGIMRDGECLNLAGSAQITPERACLLPEPLQTPTRHNSKEGAYPGEYTRHTPTLAAQVGGKINPCWNEQRMGWPIKWTDLRPLAMVKTRESVRSHGICSDTRKTTTSNPQENARNKGDDNG